MYNVSKAFGDGFVTALCTLGAFWFLWWFFGFVDEVPVAGDCVSASFWCGGLTGTYAFVKGLFS